MKADERKRMEDEKEEGGKRRVDGRQERGKRKGEDILLFFLYLLLPSLLVNLPDAIDASGLQGFSQLPLLLLPYLDHFFGFSLLDSKTRLKMYDQFMSNIYILSVVLIFQFIK